MKKRTARRLFMVPGVILLGIVIMAALILGNKPPEQIEQALEGTLVDVIVAQRTDRDVIITGHGIIQALHQIALMPQVGGNVIWVDPDFLAGGSFNEGDALVRIEPADYKLGVQQAEAMVAQAVYQLEITQANAEIARTEWDLLHVGGESDDEPSALVLYEPQLRQADANLKSALAALTQNELNLERTVLRAPFNCKVASENVAPGQQISPQTVVGHLYSTDIAEIEVSLRPSELAYIDIPGAEVEIIIENGNDSYVFNGFIHRQVGVIGDTGRLARVVVRMKGAFSDDNPMLSLGSFVETAIHGTTVQNIIPVPRSAVHSNNTIWIAEDDNTLSIRTVEVYYKTNTEVYISEGLETGEQIVMTSINGAANGMKLRPQPLENGR